MIQIDFGWCIPSPRVEPGFREPVLIASGTIVAGRNTDQLAERFEEMLLIVVTSITTTQNSGLLLATDFC